MKDDIIARANSAIDAAIPIIGSDKMEELVSHGLVVVWIDDANRDLIRDIKLSALLEDAVR
jgi:hypothetical protein